jgi:hypothetical protein
LGSDLYQSAEEMGFKARDYAALRALPESDQKAVADALASDDKDAAISVLADLVSRQGARTAAAEAEAAEAKADYEAASKIIGEKSEELTKLRVDRLRKPAALSDEMKAWGAFVAGKIAEIRHALAQIDQVRESAMQLETPEPGTAAWDAHARDLGILANEIDRLNPLALEVEGVARAYNSTLALVACGMEPEDAP